MTRLQASKTTQRILTAGEPVGVHLVFTDRLKGSLSWSLRKLPLVPCKSHRGDRLFKTQPIELAVNSSGHRPFECRPGAGNTN